MGNEGLSKDIIPIEVHCRTCGNKWLGLYKITRYCPSCGSTSLTWDLIDQIDLERVC